MSPPADIVQVLVTLEKDLLEDPDRVALVVRRVERVLGHANRDLLRYGVLSGEIGRDQVTELSDLPGVLAVNLDAQKFALGS